MKTSELSDKWKNTPQIEQDFSQWAMVADAIVDDGWGRLHEAPQEYKEPFENHVEDEFRDWAMKLFDCLGYDVPKYYSKLQKIPSYHPYLLPINYKDDALMKGLMELYHESMRFMVKHACHLVLYAEFEQHKMDDLKANCIRSNQTMRILGDESGHLLIEIDLLKNLKDRAEPLAERMGLERKYLPRLHEAEAIIKKRFGDNRIEATQAELGAS